MNIVFVENDEILVTVKKSMPMERQSFISPCYGPGRKKKVSSHRAIVLCEKHVSSHRAIQIILKINVSSHRAIQFILKKRFFFHNPINTVRWHLLTTSFSISPCYSPLRKKRSFFLRFTTTRRDETFSRCLISTKGNEEQCFEWLYDVKFFRFSGRFGSGRSHPVLPFFRIDQKQKMKKNTKFSNL